MPKYEKDILIIIPTLNEVKSIFTLISDILIHFPEIHILVVDDGSNDGTINLLSKLQTLHKNLIIINRGKKLGLGSAYRSGFNYAITHNYYFIIQMDGDGSHQVNDLAKLIHAESNYDLVIGSRYISGGKIEGWKSHRKIISKFGNIFAKKILNLKTNDATSGFKRLSKKIFENKIILNSKTNGYGFQVEIINVAENNEFSILELPITFIDRKFGSSKFNFFIILEAFISITKWAIRK
jgi:dolichol-phosphate mannosyltransferase